MKTASVLIVLMAFLSSSGVSMNQQPDGRAVILFDKKTSINLTAYEKRVLQIHSQERLPEFLAHLQEHAELNEISWTLLTAVCYQESQWIVDAQSHKGALGLMQLTEQTAGVYSVKDRKNPIESIRGGASHLKYLFEKTSKKIPLRDRWSIAIAAYNIGWGHMKDAFQLAIKFKLNPHSWNDLKQVLPLLSDIQHYAELNFGFARGKETVAFVENVLRYNDAIGQLHNTESGLEFKSN